MNGRTAILVVGLAVTLANIGLGQTVYDRAANQWTCRSTDNIYTKPDPAKPTIHKYNIAAAIAHPEPHDPTNHHPLCINASKGHRIIWSWPGADHIAVSFVPLTFAGGCASSHPPFTGTPSNSGNSNSLQSGPADTNYQWCAYDVKFTSSLGPYDPHIIITGSVEALLEALKERRSELNADIKAEEKEEKKK